MSKEELYPFPVVWVNTLFQEILNTNLDFGFAFFESLVIVYLIGAIVYTAKY